MRRPSETRFFAVDLPFLALLYIPVDTSRPRPNTYPMRRLLSLTFILAFSLLQGCGSSSSSSANPAYPQLTGNWQIESASLSPKPNLVLLGALQNSGSEVTGTFRFSNLTQPTTCGLNEIVHVTGTVGSAGNISLTSAALTDGSILIVKLLLPAVLTTQAAGTLEVTGSACAASTQATGVQIASVTGKFAGTLNPGTLTSPTAGTSGTGSLVLTQSATPSPDGQFQVTGTLAYTLGSCTSTVNLTGKANGVGILLGSTAPLGAPVLLDGVTDPAADKVVPAVLFFDPAPCSTSLATSATYSGTLTRQ